MFNLKTLSASIALTAFALAGPAALAGDHKDNKSDSDTPTPIVKPTQQQSGDSRGAANAQEDHDEVTRQSPYKRTYPQEKTATQARQSDDADQDDNGTDR